MAICAVLATIVVVGTLRRTRELVSWLIMAMFLSFAVEPAVNYLNRRFHWRRGLATALVLFCVAAALVLLLALVVPVLVRELQMLPQSVSAWMDEFNTWTEQHLHRTAINASQMQATEQAADTVSAWGSQLAGNLVKIGMGVISVTFALLTIGLFTFYLTANGPKVRRAICSVMREERQRNVLWPWETAIDKTGGYFYSRLLLMIINGVIVFAALLLVGCPFALPLALFEAFVTEFTPVVGTYIGGAIPLVAVLASNGLHQAIIILVVLIIYQQIENLVLSPVLSRRTMELNPGIAFGSVIAGGMLAGAMGAFLALPAAAVIQAFFTTYVKRYDVVEAGAAHVEAGEAGGRGDAASKPP